MEASRALTLSLIAVVLVGTVAALPSAPSLTPDRLPAPEGLQAFRGDMHAHTAYSDGEDTPAEAFQQARDWGVLDFFVITDHSEWFVFPFAANDGCIIPGEDDFADPACADPDHTSLDEGQLEWTDTATQAEAYSGDGFLAMRGFEWSSPAQGHINVYFTDHWVDFLMTGGVVMDPFYAWLDTAAGDKAVATFNHPGREPLMFDDLRYVPEVDDEFVALEAFNRDDEYSTEYIQALNRGWHVGATGVTDGHTVNARIRPDGGHTMVLAEELTPEALREAWLAHRTVATLGVDLDARLTVDGAVLGSTIEAPVDGTLDIHVELLDSGGDAFTRYDIIGPGYVLATVLIDPTTSITADHEVNVAELGTTALGEAYVLVRAWQGGEPVIVTSPVWVAV